MKASRWYISAANIEKSLATPKPEDQIIFWGSRENGLEKNP